jgi:hypothetical protein
MTTPVTTPPACPFDAAFDAAVWAAIEAGWTPPEEAFIAVVVMRADGMDAAVIERLFRDCKRWIQ